MSADAEGSGTTGPALADLSAADAVARMARGELTAERYASALLDRCRAARALNAFIHLDEERVLEQARTRDRELAAGHPPGPLFGLPVPVKDSIDTSDQPTTAGTPALRGFRPARDAAVVARLRAAGAFVLGKTNLHELSYGWTSDNRAFGAVRNPFDAARIAGGSSGGTAAAIAARLAPLGVAEDTEGSIRVPAALCGVVGFRPTTGRYPNDGCVPITPLFDQVGPIARSVGDVRLFDQAVAGAGTLPPEPTLHGTRLGVVRDYGYTDLDPDIERLADVALATLARAGCEIVEIELPQLGALIERTAAPIQRHDLMPSLSAYLARHREGPDFQAVYRAASADIRAAFTAEVLPGGRDAPSAAAYREALDTHLPRLRALLAAAFRDHDLAALVWPATRVPAPRIGEDAWVQAGAARLPFDYAIARNVSPGSTAGLPGLVLPMGLTPLGLPAALEFDAPAGEDVALLALGLALERALAPWPRPFLTTLRHEESA